MCAGANFVEPMEGIKGALTVCCLYQYTYIGALGVS